MDPTHSIEEQARRWRTGLVGRDAATVERWYGTEYPAVWRIALGFLARPDEADDVAQDAMLRLLDVLSEWDAARPYRAWRNAIVANLCRDRLRRIETRRRIETSAGAVRTPGSLPAPDQAAEDGEVRRLVADALAGLTDREREVFVLRDLEGVPTDEVASTLGVGESTVRTLLSLARRRIRDLLAPKLAHEP